jgi:hypothetical protein
LDIKERMFFSEIERIVGLMRLEDRLDGRVVVPQFGSVLIVMVVVFMVLVMIVMAVPFFSHDK